MPNDPALNLHAYKSEYNFIIMNGTKSKSEKRIERIAMTISANAQGNRKIIFVKNK